jgi:thiamine biosynthesis lipoprotein
MPLPRYHTTGKCQAGSPVGRRRAPSARQQWIGWMLIMLSSSLRAVPAAGPTFAGPAMGTTYRVKLADPPTMPTLGELHRDVERLLADIDRAASTYRQDSEISRFNQAAAEEWVLAGDHLFRLAALSQEMHRATAGRFDVTVAPLVDLWAGVAPGNEPAAEMLAEARATVGMDLLQLRPATATRAAALRKTRSGVMLDLGAIGPGYAVDQIGERLVALGSRGHLVEVGGEVRAWGRSGDGQPWRVALRGGGIGRPQQHVVTLDPGEAIAVSARTRRVIDPRTGRPAAFDPEARVDSLVRAGSCAEADAWATARLLPEWPAAATPQDEPLRSGPQPRTPSPSVPLQ